MEELLKAINIFLSVYGLCLDGNLEDNMLVADNFGSISIIDRHGSISGFFQRVDDKKSVISVTYGLVGSLEAEVISHVIPCQGSEYRPHIILYTFSSCNKREIADNSFNFQGKMIINNVGKNGKIDFHVRNNICAKHGYTPMVEVDNGMGDYFYRIQVPYTFSSLVLGFYSEETTFSYKNSDNSHLRIEKSNHGGELNSANTHLLVDYFYYCDDVRKHMSPKFDVENPDLKSITDIYKAAMATDGRFYQVIEDARELLMFDGICIFDNLASLCSYKFSDDELKLMYGYNPKELKRTPVIGENGEVILPKNKEKRKVRA